MVALVVVPQPAGTAAEASGIQWNETERKGGQCSAMREGERERRGVQSEKMRRVTRNEENEEEKEGETHAYGGSLGHRGQR